MDVSLETDERVKQLYNLLYHKVLIETTVKVSPEFMLDPYFAYSSDKEYVTFVGYLKTVDPETKAAVLIFIKDETVLRSMMVMGHCIKSISLYQKEQDDNEMVIRKLSSINFDSHDIQECSNRCSQEDQPDILQTLNVDRIDELKMITNQDHLESPETIRNIVEKTDKVQLSRYYADNTPDEATNRQMNELKETIKSWLVTNKIPVETKDGTNDLVIANCVTLKPPYTDECNYICPNRIVLYRIKSIIDPFIKKVLEDHRTYDEKNIVD